MFFNSMSLMKKKIDNLYYTVDIACGGKCSNTTHRVAMKYTIKLYTG